MQEYYKVTKSYLQILVQLVGSNIVNQPDLSMLRLVLVTRPDQPLTRADNICDGGSKIVVRGRWRKKTSSHPTQ
jgi:hypothetical protein